MNSSSYKSSLPTVAEAAKSLQNRGIEIVEYGEQLEHRLGNPVVLQTVEWAVPDESLLRASQTLVQNGFPKVLPSKLIEKIYGEWESTGSIHGVEGSSYAPLKLRIRLYPLSFVGLKLQDTVQVTSTFSSRQYILSPKPTSYMLSLIRYLLNHAVGDINRAGVYQNLLNFTTFFIFKESQSMKEDEDNESEEDFQKRVNEAVLWVKSWDWGSTEQNYLDCIERVIRDCQCVYTLSSCPEFPSPSS